MTDQNGDDALEGLRVLVVEDETLVAMLLEDMLAATGAWCPPWRAHRPGAGAIADEGLDLQGRHPRRQPRRPASSPCPKPRRKGVPFVFATRLRRRRSARTGGTGPPRSRFTLRVAASEVLWWLISRHTTREPGASPQLLSALPMLTVGRPWEAQSSARSRSTPIPRPASVWPSPIPRRPPRRGRTRRPLARAHYEFLRRLRSPCSACCGAPLARVWESRRSCSRRVPAGRHHRARVATPGALCPPLIVDVAHAAGAPCEGSAPPAHTSAAARLGAMFSPRLSDLSHLAASGASARERRPPPPIDRDARSRVSSRCGLRGLLARLFISAV